MERQVQLVLIPQPPFQASLLDLFQARPAGSGLSVSCKPRQRLSELCLTMFPFSLTSFTSSVGEQRSWGALGHPVPLSTREGRCGCLPGDRTRRGQSTALWDFFVPFSKFWPEPSRDGSQTLLHTQFLLHLQVRASALLTSPWRAGSPYFFLVRLQLWALPSSSGFRAVALAAAGSALLPAGPDLHCWAMLLQAPWPLPATFDFVRCAAKDWKSSGAKAMARSAGQEHRGREKLAVCMWLK